MMDDLRTKTALVNLSHDLILADLYKYLICDDRALWCELDNRSRFIVHCPESYAGKDLVVHWGPSRSTDGKPIKTTGGDSRYRSQGVFNLELKTTSNKKRLSTRLREANRSATTFNKFYIRTDELISYPFSVGVACYVDENHLFNCGAICITANNLGITKLLGEYYNELELSQGIRTLFDVVNDSTLFEELIDFEPWHENLCDSVKGMGESDTPPPAWAPPQNDEYEVFPVWESTPPPQAIAEPTLEQIKEAYKESINQSFLLGKKLKPLAIELLGLIDESHGSPYLEWVDFAMHLKNPIERVKRWVPLIAEAQIFDINKQRIGKSFKYQISLKKELINGKS